jgi:hypothetical protein
MIFWNFGRGFYFGGKLRKIFFGFFAENLGEKVCRDFCREFGREGLD